MRMFLAGVILIDFSVNAERNQEATHRNVRTSKPAVPARGWHTLDSTDASARQRSTRRSLPSRVRAMLEWTRPTEFQRQRISSVLTAFEPSPQGGDCRETIVRVDAGIRSRLDWGSRPDGPARLRVRRGTADARTGGRLGHGRVQDMSRIRKSRIR